MKRTLIGLMLMGLIAMPMAAIAGEQEKGMEMNAEAMTEAMAKASAVGEEHEWLAKMAGNWSVEAKFWMAPGGEPMMTQGKAERMMALGGRVLMEKYKGSFMGKDFEGIGMTGYDNMKKHFWGSWCDTMSTAMMMMTGECNSEGDTCTFHGSFDDPMSGKSMKMKSVSHFQGSDKEVVEAYLTLPDGSEMKMMELVYTRMK